ncbi:sensor histidine kinase [Flectobacillus major]|uniref:sensor histidine kinase n=1 Tax=Flectobacillus major TaxID=103 RepID=UPI0005C487CE|nr:HAMP domain-containing sensor histidine kinase [Flectobacillus major]
MVGITFNICAIDTKQKGYTLSYYKNKAENAKVNRQYDSVFYYAQKGYLIAKQQRIRSYLPYYYYYLCFYYKLIKNDLPEADKLIKKAAKEALILKDYFIYGQIMYQQATIYLDMDRQYEAVNQIFHNIKSSGIPKSIKPVSNNFIVLSNLYLKLGEDSLWAHYLRKYIVASNEYYNKNNKPITIQQIDNFFLAELSLYKHDADNTYKYLKEAQRLYQQHKLSTEVYHRSLIMVLNTCIKYHNEREAPRIMAMIHPSYFYRQKSPEKAAYYFYRSVIHVYNKDYSKARKMLNKRAVICKNTIEDNMLVLETQFKVLEHEGKYKEALYIYKKMDSLSARQKEKLKKLELKTLEQKLIDDYNSLQIYSMKQKVKIQSLEKVQQQQQLLVAQKKIILISILLIGLFVMLVIFINLGSKLRKQTKKLALLIENKDRIFSIIGHDLRGPIISILSLSPQINRPGFQLNQEKYLKNLLFTVDNLLQWSISQQEKIFPKRIEINVFDVIEEVLEELEAFIQLAEVDIRVNYNINDTIVVFDEYHLKIIIRNILHNAIKFTPKKGAIYIYTTHTDFLNIHIQDTGNGIGSSVHHTNARSTKIGLELVHKLIDLNKAKLKVVSQQGIGTNVSIIFWG